MLLEAQVCTTFYESSILFPVAMAKASRDGRQFATKAKEEARSTGVMSWSLGRVVP